MAALETIGSVLVASEDNYAWASHTASGQTVNNNSGNDANFNLEAADTTVLMPSSRVSGYVNASGQLDFSSLKFGDRLKITLEATVSTSISAGDLVVKIILFDGSSLSMTFTNTALTQTSTQVKEYKMQESAIGLATFAVEDKTVGYQEKIIPLSLKIEVN